MKTSPGQPMSRATALRFALSILLAPLAIAGCSDDDGVGPGADRPFHEGTTDNPEIGAVLNSTGNTLRLFQVGDPSRIREIPLGASAAVTPVGLAIAGNRVAVPLGNAASVAVIDIETLTIDRHLLFPSGNVTGAAFAGDDVLIAANLLTNQVGRVDLTQGSDQIGSLVDVAPGPTDVEVIGSRALVVSDNLDENWMPLGNGIVTILEAATMKLLGTVDTGGENPQGSAVGPDGKLYVVNTGDYWNPGSVAVIDPVAMALERVIGDAGVGPGAITIDPDGFAHISGYFLGTLVLDTRTGQWVRGADNPVCARLADGSCRGAPDAVRASDGRLYQTFFGSPGEGLPPRVFVYEAGSYALVDSLEAGPGPSAIRMATFR